jgi:L-threonylcarbamoyladenylate synthase
MRISVSEALHLLALGKVVSLPTETVYGLAALLKYPQAIDTIFTLKGRPSSNPLIIHVANQQQISAFTQHLPTGFDQLAQAFWPGPMTLVINIKEELIPFQARAGLPTAAFRVPDHPLTLDLLSSCGPLVMPSANLSGRPSSTSPSHVEEDFGSDFPLVDGGSCKKGLESTILMHDEDRWKIIRLGVLEPEVFKPILGYIPEVASTPKGKKPLCPGQLYRHYAPRARLTLTKHFPKDLKELILGFSGATYPPGCDIILLGSLNNPQQVAENLYSTLRQLDENNTPKALVDVRIPNEGLWITIAERLQKASNIRLEVQLG